MNMTVLLSRYEFVIRKDWILCLFCWNNVTKVYKNNLLLETYLKQLSNIAIDDHEGFLNKMDHSILDGYVGLDDFSQDDALSMLAISEKIVTFHIICKSVIS